MSKILLLGLGLLLALSVVPGAAAGHYVPQTGDSFGYHEVITVGNGTGDYQGYSDSSFINGTESVTAVSPNGTESASYQYSVSYRSNTGSSEQWSSQGDFTFSAFTFHYVDGTDNQTGYSDPLVWFYMNNSLPVGAQFYLLNTEFRLDSTNASYALESHPGQYVKTVFAEGNGSYERNDAYGVLAATYNEKTYFDPATGYIVGYDYTETDTNSSASFTLSDLLYVTSTTYTLTPAAAPPSPPASSSGSGTSTLEVVAVVVILLILVIIVVALLLRSRSHSRLPKHPPSGAVSYAPPPMPAWTGAPPPVNLTPSQQPPVQQVVLREVVKVNCQYCGALMDSTARACPNCGAPRS
jgi:hypothetical protein